jgi:hypothetical protein
MTESVLRTTAAHLRALAQTFEDEADSRLT